MPVPPVPVQVRVALLMPVCAGLDEAGVAFAGLALARTDFFRPAGLAEGLLLLAGVRRAARAASATAVPDSFWSSRIDATPLATGFTGRGAACAATSQPARASAGAPTVTILTARRTPPD